MIRKSFLLNNIQNTVPWTVFDDFNGEEVVGPFIKKNCRRLKNATAVNTSKLSEKFGLASLKAEIDKVDPGKWSTASIDLIKFRKEVNTDVVKRNCV